MRHRRHDVNVVTPLSQEGRHEVCQLTCLGDVDLVEHDQARTLLEPGAVRDQFGLDDVEVGEGVAPGVERGAVEHVHEPCAPLNMAKELQTQPAALAGAGNEPRNVGHGEHDLARRHDPEVGHQSGERIVGDLRPRRRHGGHQT
ncbi:unannotated protein [freshwater metagenome]|uniref:Unannotated protein n=1 Tax=freshwater metagenome TaxID=449393 RepID=A0A6J7LG33_9ZZZZ